MALAAAQVVDALAARVAGMALLGAGGVKTSRAWPWAEADLPAARAFAADEAVQLAGIDFVNQHLLNVDLQFTTQATADLDDDMNALAAQALPLLFAQPVPYGLQLTGINRQLAAEGEAAIGRITLQLQATFYVAPASPETIISQ